MVINSLITVLKQQKNCLITVYLLANNHCFPAKFIKNKLYLIEKHVFSLVEKQPLIG